MTNGMFAPFYAGQKVVAVDAMPGAVWKNGETYTISQCIIRIGNDGNKYWYVGTTCYNNGEAHYRPSIFAPLQQKSFPLMTFAKIREIERIQILVDN